MILKRDTDIHFMCVSRDEDYRPIVKKGILHQYGSDKKFTFEEQIELSCKKRTLLCKYCLRGVLFYWFSKVS